jgi:hypothetical protein
MSNVYRLQKSDKLFFVTVNLLRPVPDLSAQDFPFLVQAIEDSRRRHHFLFCGYVLMPDHWHALVWATVSCNHFRRGLGRATIILLWTKNRWPAVPFRLIACYCRIPIGDKGTQTEKPTKNEKRFFVATHHRDPPDKLYSLSRCLATRWVEVRGSSSRNRQ